MLQRRSDIIRLCSMSDVAIYFHFIFNCLLYSLSCTFVSHHNVRIKLVPFTYGLLRHWLTYLHHLQGFTWTPILGGSSPNTNFSTKKSIRMYMYRNYFLCLCLYTECPEKTYKVLCTIILQPLAVQSRSLHQNASC